MNKNINKWYNGEIEDESYTHGFWDLSHDIAKKLSNNDNKVLQYQTIIYNCIKYDYMDDIKKLYAGGDYER